MHSYNTRKATDLAEVLFDRIESNFEIKKGMPMLFSSVLEHY